MRVEFLFSSIISCGLAQVYLVAVQLHFVRIDNHVLLYREYSLFQARVSRARTTERMKVFLGHLFLPCVKFCIKLK